MRGIARALLALIGLVALLAGVVGAAYVGSDDEVVLDPQTPAAKAGQPVVTAPRLLGYDGLDLIVRASADGGVFLGAGSPIDVGSLADQVDHYEVTGIRRDRLLGAGRSARADDPVPLPDLATLPDWRVRADGKGRQEIRLDLEGDAVQVMAMPHRRKAVPSLAFGVHLGGLFRVLVALAAAGAVLLALASGLMWRAGRRRRQARRELDRPMPVEQAHRERIARFGIVGVVGLSLALGGCGYVPTQVEPAVAPRAALAPDDLDAMLKDYDKRYNRALDEADPPSYQTTLWRTADAGPAAEMDIYQTTLRRELETKLAKRPIADVSHRGLHVYAASFASYPMWAVVAAATEGGEVKESKSAKETKGKKGKKAKQDVTDQPAVEVFVRQTAASPWIRRTTTRVRESALPHPTQRASPPLDDKATMAAARDATRAVTAFIATGRAGKIKVDREARLLHKWLTVERPLRRWFIRNEVTFDKPFDPEDSQRIVAVEGGHLALTTRTMRFRQVFRDNPGYGTATWAEGFDSVNGEDSIGLYADYSVSFAILLPDDGSPPQVLGTGLMSDIT